jgi:ferrochelatase
VVFSAHSLPARILDWGDPYDAQLRDTARLLAERLNLPAERWLFCYQSAGHSPEPWLGPQIEDVIVDLARAGEKRLLVVPIGFVCDHVEVLYDIDIESRQLAKAHGARLERSQSLNTSPAFIAVLADLVKNAKT